MRLRAAVGGIVASLCVSLWSFNVIAAEADLQLVDAAKAQDWKAAGALLDHGVDANSATADGATALHWAAFWNDLETLERLIEAGANVDAANDYGATPLWCACASRHTEIVGRLLDAAANPNASLQSGESVLMRCVHTGDVIAVRGLLAHGADANYREPSKYQTALMWAAGTGPEATRVLLEHGANIDARTKTERQRHGTGMLSTTSPAGAEIFRAGGFTPLLFAARNGNTESARLLLATGADLHETAADGNTALLVAAMSGHGRLAELFLDSGADPNAADAGYAALHAAVLRSDSVLVRALLARGADLEAPIARGSPVRRYTYDYVFTKKETGATPFLLAARYLEAEIAKMLSEAGADPLVALDNGTTALIAAVGLGQTRSQTRRSQLLAPELIAARWKNEVRVLDTVRTVLEAGTGATINHGNRAGDTALHGAARYGYPNVVELLVEHGANLDLGNKEGTTPRAILEW